MRTSSNNKNVSGPGSNFNSPAVNHIQRTAVWEENKHTVDVGILSPEAGARSVFTSDVLGVQYSVAESSQCVKVLQSQICFSSCSSS